MKRITALAFLSSALIVTAIGDANARHGSRGYAAIYEGRTLYAFPRSPHCAKMCPQDFSPCDPIYFKTADGRCAGVPMGGH